MSIEELSKRLETKQNSTLIRGGIGPLSLLGVAFVVLKLVGVINWSWWWVLAPFWIPAVLALGLVVILLVVLGIVLYLDKKTNKVKPNTTTAKTKPSTKKKKSDGNTKKNE